MATWPICECTSAWIQFAYLCGAVCPHQKRMLWALHLMSPLLERQNYCQQFMVANILVGRHQEKKAQGWRSPSETEPPPPSRPVSEASTSTTNCWKRSGWDSNRMPSWGDRRQSASRDQERGTGRFVVPCYTARVPNESSAEDDKPQKSLQHFTGGGNRLLSYSWVEWSDVSWPFSTVKPRILTKFTLFHLDKEFVSSKNKTDVLVIFS